MVQENPVDVLVRGPSKSPVTVLGQANVMQIRHDT